MNSEQIIQPEPIKMGSNLNSVSIDLKFGKWDGFFPNLIEISKKIDENKNKIFLFRGHRDLDWKLEPKINRVKDELRKDIIINKLEEDILKDFKFSSEPYLSEAFKPDNELEWLFLAQHYGVSTRLLDWTENPLIALWFAFENEKNEGKDRRVWYLSFDRNLVHDFKKDFPIETEKIFFLRPPLKTRRIISQGSWFTRHPNKDENNLLILSNDLIEENYSLDSYTFKDSERKEVLSFLKIININQGSVYQDLTSVSKYVLSQYSNIFVE